MSDDPRVTVPAELVDALREALVVWGRDCISGSRGEVLTAARALVDSTWDEGLQKSLDSAMPGWRSSIDHGGRGWEATANGWRCTECHHEVVGPVDVHIDAAHVCPPVPVSDEAEADPRDDAEIREAWDEWNRNTPESFWDVAVWPRRKPGDIEPSIVGDVSLDVANRFEIWAHGFRAARQAGKDEQT